MKRLKVLCCEEGANSVRINSHPIRQTPPVLSRNLRSLTPSDTTYFWSESAEGEEEFSNTASDVVPANTFVPIRAAKPAARRAPKCLVKRNKKIKNLKSHEKSVILLGPKYSNLAPNIVVVRWMGECGQPLSYTSLIALCPMISVYTSYICSAILSTCQNGSFFPAPICLIWNSILSGFDLNIISSKLWNLR